MLFEVTMKVELKDARVELEVVDGKSTLCINGQKVSVTRDVGVSLIFGDGVKYIAPEPTPPSTKAKGRSGPQSPAARKKLSEALKRYHAQKRQQKLQKGKGKLNGASAHFN